MVLGRARLQPCRPEPIETRALAPEGPAALSLRFILRSGGLIEADHVSSRIPEPRRNVGRVRADRLHDLATVGDDGINGRGRAIDHNVKQKAGLCAGRAPEYPGAAHFAGRVIKGRTAIAACPDVPAEDLFVEVRRAL